MKSEKWYNINPIVQTKAKYNFIIGKRVIGKTVAITDYMLSRYIKYIKWNAINYYVCDDCRSYEYVQSIIESDFPSYTVCKPDGIHYKNKKYIKCGPIIYTSKLNDIYTWKKDYNQLPDNIVFDDVRFGDINNVHMIFRFLNYVGVGDKTKIWIIGNTWENPKDFLRQFLIKDFPNKAGLYTYDISEDVRISVEVIK